MQNKVTIAKRLQSECKTNAKQSHNSENDYNQNAKQIQNKVTIAKRLQSECKTNAKQSLNSKTITIRLQSECKTNAKQSHNSENDYNQNAKQIQNKVTIAKTITIRMQNKCENDYNNDYNQNAKQMQERLQSECKTNAKQNKTNNKTQTTEKSNHRLKAASVLLLPVRYHPGPSLPRNPQLVGFSHWHSSIMSTNVTHTLDKFLSSSKSHSSRSPPLWQAVWNFELHKSHSSRSPPLGRVVWNFELCTSWSSKTQIKLWITICANNNHECHCVCEPFYIVPIFSSLHSIAPLWLWECFRSVLSTLTFIWM